MRWNVVIGGQLFSKSFLGYTSYKVEFAAKEGLLPAVVLMALPFGILSRPGQATAALAEERGRRLRRTPCVDLRPRKRASNSKS